MDAAGVPVQAQAPGRENSAAAASCRVQLQEFRRSPEGLETDRGYGRNTPTIYLKMIEHQIIGFYADLNEKLLFEVLR